MSTTYDHGSSLWARLHRSECVEVKSHTDESHEAPAMSQDGSQLWLVTAKGITATEAKGNALGLCADWEA